MYDLMIFKDVRETFGNIWYRSINPKYIVF